MLNNPYIKNILLYAPMVAVSVAMYYFFKRFTSLDEIISYMGQWEILGYVILAFFSLGGSFLWTIAAGIASALGVMDIKIALAVGIIFNYLGDMFLFYLGKYQKKEVIPYFKNHKRKLALSTLLMRRCGSFVIFVQKYLYGIKTIVPLAMALSKYSFKKFGFYNIFASILFVSSVMLTSYYMGDSTKEALESSKGMPWYVIPMILATIIGTIWFYFDHLTKRK